MSASALLRRAATSSRAAPPSTTFHRAASSSSSGSSGTSTSQSQSQAALAASRAAAEVKPRRQLVFKTQSGLSHFKTFLPVTPSLRHLRQPVVEHLHKGDPLRALTVAKRSTGGRNVFGRITTRARGGGHKRRIRLVDFMRLESGSQTVQRIEYDPGRSAHIALLKHDETGAVSYILAPLGLREGDAVQSFRGGVPAEFKLNAEPESAQLARPSMPGQPSSSPSPSPSQQQQAQSSLLEGIDISSFRQLAIRPGNFLPLYLIPVGTSIHGLTLSPSGPSVLCRSAGSSARIVSHTTQHAQVRVGSGEVRLVDLRCCASVGEVSNKDHGLARLGKAGRMRWLGFRPQSRGVAMNATDHPHGGGRGKSKGNRNPVDVWANPTKGTRTRSPRSKTGNKMVVKERPRRHEK